MSQIPIQKTVFNKEDFVRVVDTQFNQLIRGEETPTPVITLDEFFQLYEDLFYQIPQEGDTNSHQYILQKEAEYLGVKINTDDVQALLDEITNLRQEVLDSQTLINDLTRNNG
jgi:hypothetical protein